MFFFDDMFKYFVVETSDHGAAEANGLVTGSAVGLPQTGGELLHPFIARLDEVRVHCLYTYIAVTVDIIKICLYVMQKKEEHNRGKYTFIEKNIIAREKE